MFPAPFDYFRVSSLDEAVSLMAEHEDSKLLAGGHSLIPLLKLRLTHAATLIDIGRIPDLKGIRLDGAVIKIGSLTTHAELTWSNDLQQHCRLLAEAAGKIGDPQVRNKGTIGGNIAHADPASDLPGVLLTLDAIVHVAGREGKRDIPISEFFVGLLHTALQPGEIIESIEVPVVGPRTGCCYLKMEHPASGYAVCGASALVSMNDGRCDKVALGFNGVAEIPFVSSSVAEALAGSTMSDDEIEATLEGALEVDHPLSDAYVTADFRLQLARVYGARALAAARDRAGADS